MSSLRLAFRTTRRPRFANGSWPDDGATLAGLRTLVVGAGSAARALVRDLRQSARLRPAPRSAAWMTTPGPLDTGHPAAGPPVRSASRGARASDRGRDHRYPVPAAAGAGRHDQRSDRHRCSGPLAALVPVRHGAGGSCRGHADGAAVSALLGRQERRVLRPAAPPDDRRGQRVLVTGAGGSIGQELCRQIRSCGAAALYMLDHDESNLHSLQLRARRRGAARQRRGDHRRHPRPGPHRAGLPRDPARRRVPRRRAQAPARCSSGIRARA